MIIVSKEIFRILEFGTLKVNFKVSPDRGLVLTREYQITRSGATHYVKLPGWPQPSYHDNDVDITKDFRQSSGVPGSLHAAVLKIGDNHGIKRPEGSYIFLIKNKWYFAMTFADIKVTDEDDISYMANRAHKTIMDYNKPLLRTPLTGGVYDIPNEDKFTHMFLMSAQRKHRKMLWEKLGNEVDLKI